MDRIPAGVNDRELSSAEASSADEKKSELPAEGIGMPTGESSLQIIGEQSRESTVIDAMMDKTTIRNSDSRKVRLVRELYEKLNSEGELTSSVLRCLRDDAGLVVRFDCDADHIGNLGDAYTSITGVRLDGRRLQNHAECGEGGSRVSMAAGASEVVGRFARTLTRAALHKTFGNGGLPYSRADPIGQAGFQGIVGEVIERYSPDSGEHIKWAVESNSQVVRELALVCVVPEIIAVHGEINGKAILNDLYPELLKFYESHVYGKMEK